MIEMTWTFFFVINKEWYGFSGNNVILHEEIEHSVSDLVGNDVDTLYEEKNYLVRFSFI